MPLLMKNLPPKLWPALLAAAAFGWLAGCRTLDTTPGKYSLASPDGTLEIIVTAHGPLAYAVRPDGQPVVADSRLGLDLREGVQLGRRVKVARAERRQVDSTWENPWGKRRQVRDAYRELRLAPAGGCVARFEKL
jgi:hypothetical protein